MLNRYRIVLASLCLLLSAWGGSGSSPAPVVPWTQQLGVAGASAEGHATATDASGNVYLAGTTTGGLDGNTLAGTQDALLAKYDASGTRQ